MPFYARYKKSTGEITQSLHMPEIMVKMINTEAGELLIETPIMADGLKQYIKDGVLTPKPIADNTAN